jgi:5-methylcytosine-specific restriction endonuclease McrBC GTP-binding regulatory subunit McrB
MTSEKLSQNEIAEILADITSLIPELTENEKSFINRSLSVFNRLGRVTYHRWSFESLETLLSPSSDDFLNDSHNTNDPMQFFYDDNLVIIVDRATRQLHGIMLLTNEEINRNEEEAFWEYLPRKYGWKDGVFRLADLDDADKICFLRWCKTNTNDSCFDVPAC